VAIKNKTPKFKLALPLAGKVMWSFVWRYCLYAAIGGLIEGAIWIVTATAYNNSTGQSANNPWLGLITLLVMLVILFLALKQSIESNIKKICAAFIVPSVEESL